jgi:hypothetical protein
LGFRIGLLYTRFASMPQALWAALREDGRAEPATRPQELRSAGEALLRTDRLGSRRRYGGEAWTRLSAGTGSGRCSRGGRW